MSCPGFLQFPESTESASVVAILIKLGVPAVIALGLVYVMAMSVTSGLAANNEKLNALSTWHVAQGETLRRMDASHTVIAEDLRIQRGLLLQICVNGAHDVAGRARCLDANK